MNKQDYNKLLHKGICEVQFTKKDGTLRTMQCTLVDGILEYTDSGTGRTRTTPDHQVPVFDIEKQAFRSFTTDSVVSFKLIKRKQKQVVCPCCNKKGGISDMHRYHFSHCKSNKIEV